MAYEAGVAYLSVIPSMRGGASTIVNEMAGPMRAAGQQGGATYAGAIGQGEGRKGFAAAGARAGGFFVAAFAAVGAAEIGRAAVDFLQGSIDAAGTMAETQSKLNEIFGQSRSVIQDYADDSSRNILLTKQAALDGAATFGVFAKSAGLAQEDAAEFSVEMVDLAADLASFNNTSPEQAIQAIGAALRGESEPIRAYGVLLDDATLKARAMELGIYDGTGALSQQQKVLAAQAEILAQTTTQQGDAARTADSFANRQRRLEKAIEDTKVEIGEALLPVVNDLMGVFMDVGVPALQDLAKWFNENQEEIKRFILMSIDAGLAFGQAVLTMMRMWNQFRDAFITVADNVMRFWFTVADGILSAAEKAFGWIPGVGDRLAETRAAFDATRTSTERNLGIMRRASDDVTRGIRAGERAVGDLRSAVQKIDGMTSTVRVRVDLPRYSRSQIPGTPEWLAAQGVQARAHGGPVVAGRPYLVGERGPELVVPRTSGTVIANDQLTTAGSSFPSKVTLVDADGSLLGHMKVLVNDQRRAVALAGRR